MILKNVSGICWTVQYKMEVCASVGSGGFATLFSGCVRPKRRRTKSSDDVIQRMHPGPAVIKPPVLPSRRQALIT